MPPGFKPRKTPSRAIPTGRKIMNYYIEKNGKTVEMTDSEESAHRTAEAWEEMYPDATITILLVVER